MLTMEELQRSVKESADKTVSYTVQKIEYVKKKKKTVVKERTKKFSLKITKRR